MSAVLEVDDLHVAVGGDHEVIHGVSVRVGAGETVGIVGESGSGKSLTCRSVLGVLPSGAQLTAGRIAINGTVVTGLGRRGWARVRTNALGAVFQDPGSFLDPSLTVGAQLREQIRHVASHRVRRAQARERSIELLAEVGLGPDVLARYPHELSGGMLQRILLAIALSGRPRLLVADEPTTALDVVVQAEVLELLGTLRVSHDLAVLLVSHDLAVVAEVCDRVIVMYAGEVVESGPTSDVVAAPRHPYTQSLMQSGLEVIPREPGATTAGCRYADRCPLMTETCTSAAVPLIRVGDRDVRCIRANEEVYPWAL